MPTFHHWRAGKQRNGLTFQTAADARAFDKAIVMAYDDLATDGECGAQSKLRVEAKAHLRVADSNAIPHFRRRRKDDRLLGQVRFAGRGGRRIHDIGPAVRQQLRISLRLRGKSGESK